MLSTPAARTLWEQLVQWQPATAADLAIHLRAMPDDWPRRMFDVSRADAALALPPAAVGEQYPDQRPEIAPFDEIASPETCPACAEAEDDCRWHQGYSTGHNERNQAERDAVKIRPYMPLLEFMRWQADVSEALDRGQTPPPLPAVAPSALADTDLRERVAGALAGADGWVWAEGFDKTRSPSYQEYLRRAGAVLAVLPEPADRPADLEQQVRRLKLVVDEYGAGASALTDKLRHIRDLHRETCLFASGELRPPAFTCGMCEVLDAPATDLRRLADEAQQTEPRPVDSAAGLQRLAAERQPNCPPGTHAPGTPCTSDEEMGR